jgi:hypothetical protein
MGGEAPLLRKPRTECTPSAQKDPIRRGLGDFQTTPWTVPCGENMLPQLSRQRRYFLHELHQLFIAHSSTHTPLRRRSRQGNPLRVGRKLLQLSENVTDRRSSKLSPFADSVQP